MFRLSIQEGRATTARPFRLAAFFIVTFGMLLLPTLVLGRKQETEEWEDETVQYTKTAANDAISRLQKQIDSGQAHLEFSPRQGYLPSLLKQLGISTTSQTLVFSKTSFQHDLISPNAPRALYFGDDAYIGWVQGGPVLEVATLDPKLGATFYLLPQQQVDRPKFIRRDYECLECHGGVMTGHIPGYMMRSVYARADGMPDFAAGSYLTTDQSPLRERWGGWYVTGRHGSQRHMGNSFSRGEGNDAHIDTEAGANITDLRSRLDTTPYLTRTSDIVALMVMEHQTHLQDLIIRANYQTRRAVHDEEALNRELGLPSGEHRESTLSRIKGACEPLVRTLLCSGEEPLTAPIVGSSGFAAAFSALGPRDRQGRSLRDLDLQHRLLRYPCSYLIYSEAFDALPDAAKTYVYDRLHQVLDGQDRTPAFAHLSDTDRKAIVEILKETKPEFKAEQKDIKAERQKE